MQNAAETIAKKRLDLAFARVCEALTNWEKAKSGGPLDHSFVTAEVRVEQARRNLDDAMALVASLAAFKQSNP
jgi:hypothetical protein